MDKIYKTINADNSRSHRTGLLPFVRFNGCGGIENVTALNIDGNYGEYVCDFCIFDESDGKKSEITRMRYLDVLNWYNKSNEILKNSQFVKKVTITTSTISNINCGNNNYSDDNTVITKETTTKTVFHEKSVDVNNFDRYTFVPIDSIYVTLNDDFYVFNEPHQYTEAIKKGENDRTEDEKTLIEKINRFKNLIDDGDYEYFVLMPDYDEFYRINETWNNWWDENFNISGWEALIFDGYITNPYDSIFKFCYDIETYVLGIKHVYGENIIGANVPNIVHFTNIINEIEWFEANSAKTLTAYETKDEASANIINKWELKGGGEYYNFIKNISPSWQTQKNVKNSANKRCFEYVAPNVILNAMFNSEYDYETIYEICEYNIEKKEKVGAVNNYKPTPIDELVYIENAIDKNGKINYVNRFFKRNTISSTTISGITKYFIDELSVSANGLTKQWAEFEEGALKCESQLESMIYPGSTMVTNNLLGVFMPYDENNPENGQMFKCTYKEEWSKEPEVKEITEHLYIEYVPISGSNEFEVNRMIDDWGGFIETTPEVPPETNAYQVLSVSVLSESSTTVQSEQYTEEYINGNGNREVFGTLYTSASTWYKYGWWDCEKVFVTSGLTCADGEYVRPKNSKKYRNVTILSCLDNLIEEKKDGDFYYVLSRYDNGNINPRNVGKIGEIHPLNIPYKEGYCLNYIAYDDSTMTYDKVTKIDINDGICKIEYSKGITSGCSNENKSGIRYTETIPCEINICESVPIDGAYNAELYYNKLNRGENAETVTYDELKLSRSAHRASIIGMEVGTQWSENSAVDAFLITKDSSETLYFNPRYDIDLLYNRGNAAAWENHFKISECNTFDDLIKYGNNFFNL